MGGGGGVVVEAAGGWGGDVLKRVRWPGWGGGAWWRVGRGDVVVDGGGVGT